MCTATSVYSTQIEKWEILSGKIGRRNTIVFHHISDKNIIFTGTIDQIKIDPAYNHRPPLVTFFFLGEFQNISDPGKRYSVSQISFPPEEVIEENGRWEFTFSNPSFFQGKIFTVTVYPTDAVTIEKMIKEVKTPATMMIQTEYNTYKAKVKMFEATDGFLIAHIESLYLLQNLWELINEKRTIFSCLPGKISHDGREVEVFSFGTKAFTVFGENKPQAKISIKTEV